MNRERTLPATEPCPNCGERTPGNYCRECGQRRAVHVLSLRRLIADAVEDQLALNAALPRTLKALLLHPGLLTQEYLRGRVAYYIPPFRLYLLASFLFFLTVALLGSCNDGAADAAAAAPADSVAVQVEADSAAARERRRVLQRHETLAEFDRGTNAFFSRFDIPFEDAIRTRLRERTLLVHGATSFDELWKRELKAKAPIVIFLLVPVFTAIMKLLYIRQRRFYVEHFVFALHLHAFVFLTLALLVLLNGWPRALLALWLLAYLWLSMRRVGQQGRFITTVKYIVLSQVYSLLVLTAVVLMALFTFLFAPI